jgi:hypothetical protein
LGRGGDEDRADRGSRGDSDACDGDLAQRVAAGVAVPICLGRFQQSQLSQAGERSLDGFVAGGAPRRERVGVGTPVARPPHRSGVGVERMRHVALAVIHQQLAVQLLGDQPFRAGERTICGRRTTSPRSRHTGRTTHPAHGQTSADLWERSSRFAAMAGSGNLWVYVHLKPGRPNGLDGQLKSSVSSPEQQGLAGGAYVEQTPAGRQHRPGASSGQPNPPLAYPVQQL